MALDNFRTIELIWDKADKSIIKTIRTASSDTTGRYLSVKVLDEGQEVDMTGAKLQLYWEHPNFNTTGTDNFTAVDNNGLFHLSFSDEMLTNVGELNAHLVLTLSDGKITSDGFPIQVFKGADDGVVVPTNGSGLVKQIEGKIDKGNVTLNDLTQEVKLAMTGGSVAILGEESVGTENVKNYAITKEKTDFILNAGNSVIMDENTPTESGHLDQYTGEFTSSNQATTIPVTLKANTAYKLVYHATTGKGIEQTFPRMVMIYDMSGNFIERLATPEQVENIIYPVDRQIRVNYNLELADGDGVIHDFRLYELNPSLENQPKLDSSIKILTESLVDKSVSLAKIGDDVIAEHNPAIIDIDTPLYTGYLDFTTGAFTSATSRHYTTDYHELEQGIAYRLDVRYINADGSVGTSPRVIGVYNSDGSFSRGITNTTEAKNFTLVNDERRARVNFSYLTTEGGQLEVLRLYPIDEGYTPSLRLNSDINIDAKSIDGLDGVQGYDQDLNTNSDVSFNSVSTNGQLPTGTLTAPPTGLVSGDVWADTTDSVEFPILRVKI